MIAELEISISSSSPQGRRCCPGWECPEDEGGPVGKKYPWKAAARLITVFTSRLLKTIKVPEKPRPESTARWATLSAPSPRHYYETAFNPVFCRCRNLGPNPRTAPPLVFNGLNRRVRGILPGAAHPRDRINRTDKRPSGTQSFHILGDPVHRTFRNEISSAGS
jgi:hypothetical protein